MRDEVEAVLPLPLMPADSGILDGQRREGIVARLRGFEGDGRRAAVGPSSGSDQFEGSGHGVIRQTIGKRPRRTHFRLTSRIEYEAVEHVGIHALKQVLTVCGQAEEDGDQEEG